MRRNFTPEEDQFIRDNYTTIPAKRISKMLGRSESTVRNRMPRIGLSVPKDIADKFKSQSHFKKGQVSANKGKKITDYMKPESIEKLKATTFKKGNIPHNTKSDNQVTIRTDNRGIKQKWIRIALGKWMPLHIYNWQETHGKVPPGMNIVFKDRDPMNADLSNLEMISNEELMRRNTIHNYPKEIVEVIQLKGVLKRKINSKSKLLSNEK